MNKVLIADKLSPEAEKIFISNEAISEINNEKIGYEIVSDVQYSSNDVFFAEGNVKILLSNGIFDFMWH